MIVDVSPGTRYREAYKNAMSAGPEDIYTKAEQNRFSFEQLTYTCDKYTGESYLKTVILDFETEEDFTMFMLKWS